MNYKRVMQEAFSVISPSISEDEIRTNVIERSQSTNEQTKYSHKRYIPLIAAAVAASATTVGVGAACNWDFAQLFNAHFQNKADDYILQTNIESQADIVDLTDMENDILQSFEFEYGRVDFKGYISDSSNIMLMYTLSIDEEALGENSQANAYWELSDGTKTHAEKSYSGQGYRGNDNSFTYCTTYSYGKNTLANGDVFRIEFTELYSFGKDTYINLPLSEPIVLQFTLENVNNEYKEIDCHHRYTDDGYSRTLDKVIVTPLSIDWYSLREKAVQSDTELWSSIEYTLSDGTVIKNYDISGTACGEYDYFSAKLDKPINPYEIISVTICGIEISLK